ncbi:MAG TPA: hypothetical protein VMU95_41380 [Trebonia sp.]|nr:hypothetical protein [Trebonia sp.]
MANDDTNEDWIKTLTWDLGDWDDFLSYLGVTGVPAAQQAAAIRQFKKLPAWQAAPPAIVSNAAALTGPNTIK